MGTRTTYTDQRLRPIMGKTYKDSWHHKETKAEAESRLQRELLNQQQIANEQEEAEWDRLEAMDKKQQKKAERDAKKAAKANKKDDKLSQKKEAACIEENENLDVTHSPIKRKMTQHEILLAREDASSPAKSGKSQKVTYDTVNMSQVNKDGLNARNVDQALEIL